MTTRTITINVTQEDIDGGCYQNGDNCPNALAMFRAFQERYFPEGYTPPPPERQLRPRNLLKVRVGMWEASITVMVDDRMKVRASLYMLPHEVRDWIKQYDDRQPVEPITYEFRYVELERGDV